MIQFAETEQDIQPYMTRTIITPEFMRFDYNKDDDDFILFDRKSKMIYSVVHQDQTIVTVEPREVKVESPIKLDFVVEKGVLGEEVPEVEGRKPEYYRYKVNGQVCYETISVKGLLPDATRAFRDYLKTLSGEHARILPRTPADMQDPCDLATNIYDYGRQYDYGFPINEWHGEYNNHYKRQLVSYEKGFEADPKLFQLPEGYHRYKPEELAGG
jgi:hypothetical protein